MYHCYENRLRGLITKSMFKEKPAAFAKFR